MAIYSGKMSIIAIRTIFLVKTDIHAR